MIAEAACELFLEQGYERTTVAQVARRAGVSRSSFFNYFGSKADVFWSEFDERIEVLLGSLTVAPVVPDPVTAVAEAVLRSLTGFAPDALALAIAQADVMGLGPELDNDMARRHWRIAAAVSAYLQRSGERALIADVRASAFSGAVIAALRAWALAGAGQESLDELLRSALAAVR